LLTAERRNVNLDQLTSAWLAEIGDIPGLQNLIIQEPGFGPAGIPIEVRLQGDGLDTLKLPALEFAEHVQSYTGVYNVIDNLRPGKLERRLSLAEGAHGLGLSAEDIAVQLRSAVLGEISDTLRIGEWDIDLVVRHALEDRQSLNNLQDLTIGLPDNRRVPLSVAVDIGQARDRAVITRIDGLRTVTVSADVDTQRGNTDAIVTDIQHSWLADFE